MDVLVITWDVYFSVNGKKWLEWAGNYAEYTTAILRMGNLLSNGDVTAVCIEKVMK